MIAPGRGAIRQIIRVSDGAVHTCLLDIRRPARRRVQGYRTSFLLAVPGEPETGTAGSFLDWVSFGGLVIKSGTTE
jgi:hypothetical protein